MISPFEDTLKKQFAKIKKVLPEEYAIPYDTEIKTFRSLQTIGGREDRGIKSWYEGLLYMENEIDRIDFDIALIGCGSYSLPLAAYIKKWEKGQFI